jgi:hypothetical protein
MTQEETTDALVEEYRQFALAYGAAMEAGRHRRANRAFDKLLRIRRALRQAGPEHARKLLRLLNDDSVYVRLSVATDAIELSPQDAERVLTNIAQEAQGMIGFEAEMTLKYWKKGEFTVPWWDD